MLCTQMTRNDSQPSSDSSYGTIFKCTAQIRTPRVMVIAISVIRAKVMAILLGPGEGFYAVAKAIATAVTSDFPNTTLGRIWAMARLAMQEAGRGRNLRTESSFGESRIQPDVYTHLASNRRDRTMKNWTYYLVATLLIGSGASAVTLAADPIDRLCYRIRESETDRPRRV